MREAIRAGKARPEQKFAVCAGGLSFSPEERCELLVVLATDPDSEIADRAQNALLALSPAAFLTALGKSDADEKLFAYCADNLGERAEIADALANNPACPTAYVARVTQHLSPAGIQALLDNLERVVEDPRLVIAMKDCRNATNEQRELLAEMQKGAEALAEVEEAAAELEPDPAKRETLLQKVAHMNVVQRLTLALKGGRTERMLLVRDPNKLIQRCVLQSPRLTDTEVEAFASMTNLSTELLRSISLTRVFMKNYTVVRNLVNNSKTPLDVSLHLFPRLNATDLAKLTLNKNVPETLRSAATKLHRKRKMGAHAAE